MTILATLTALLLRYRAWKTREATGAHETTWRALGGTVERAGWLGLSRVYRHPSATHPVHVDV